MDFELELEGHLDLRYNKNQAVSWHVPDSLDKPIIVKFIMNTEKDNENT